MENKLESLEKVIGKSLISFYSPKNIRWLELRLSRAISKACYFTWEEWLDKAEICDNCKGLKINPMKHAPTNTYDWRDCTQCHGTGIVRKGGVYEKNHH